MANSTYGQLMPFFGASGARLDPIRTTTPIYGWGARNVVALTGPAGNLSVSGTTKEAGAPVVRRVLIMTQPPQARIVYEALTDKATGAFSFPKLPPGNYVVLDCALDNSRRALVYDWIVAG